MCPVCSLPLYKVEKSYKCANDHGFDIAKEGYINLLLAHQKNSRQPGDNLQMIKSRRSFLEKGYFNPLIDCLKEMVFTSYFPRKDNTILDAGCGEGYYLGQLLKNIDTSTQAFGIDVSKEAIKLAAKRHKEAFFVVGSIARLPFLESSINVLINIFAPRNSSEFHRVLAPNGNLLVVTPAEGHLQSLREIIYNKIIAYDASSESDLRQHFILKKTKEVNYELSITQSQDIAELLQMTPFYWSASSEAQEKIAKLNHLDTTISFLIQAYQKI